MSEAGPATVPRSAWMGTARIECWAEREAARVAVDEAEEADV